MDPRLLTILIFSIYCIAFGALRYVLAGDNWGFLHHNLWLGLIPLLVAWVVFHCRWSDWKLLISWLVWLGFLPNSPYIVTDLIHLRGISTLPWFDLIVIFQFALAGLLAGALSLEWMQAAVAEKVGRRTAFGISILVVLLTGLGMVMGRDLRLKSEEILTEPLFVISRTIQNLDGESLIKAFVYSATFGVFCLLFQGLRERNRL